MQKIDLLFMADSEKGYQRWKEELATVAPFVNLYRPEDAPDLNKIEVALAWKPLEGIFPKLPNLKLIQSLGMGVDHLFKCRDLPKNVPIARIIDPDMSQQMAEYVLYGTLIAFRNFQHYAHSQNQEEWLPVARHFHEEFSIGVLGFGELGQAVTERLLKNGFPNIRIWARSPKEHPHVRTFAGKEELSQFLQGLDLLICLLPLTSHTQDILSLELFSQLNPGAYLINPARGEHLVEKDLLTALQTGQLSGALLDVFREEPLPSNHPFWKAENITITPHVAASTNPRTARDQVAENISRIKAGKVALNLIDRNQEY